jgi:hypothetical protein
MEINGRLHEHVWDEGLTDLVEGALIVAAKSLIQASGNARVLQGCAEATHSCGRRGEGWYDAGSVDW